MGGRHSLNPFLGTLYFRMNIENVGGLHFAYIKSPVFEIKDLFCAHARCIAKNMHPTVFFRMNYIVAYLNKVNVQRNNV